MSSALSAASSACDHIRDWVLGTPPGRWVSMGVPSDGTAYGVPAGIVYSFPVSCSGGKWRIVHGLPIDDKSRAKVRGWRGHGGGRGYGTGRTWPWPACYSRRASIMLAGVSPRKPVGTLEQPCPAPTFPRVLFLRRSVWRLTAPSPSPAAPPPPPPPPLDAQMDATAAELVEEKKLAFECLADAAKGAVVLAKTA